MRIDLSATGRLVRIALGVVDDVEQEVRDAIGAARRCAPLAAAMSPSSRSPEDDGAGRA